MRACFLRAFPYSTVFLSSFWFVFLLSFSKEGRKMNVKKEIIKLKQNIRLKPN